MKAWNRSVLVLVLSVLLLAGIVVPGGALGDSASSSGPIEFMSMWTIGEPQAEWLMEMGQKFTKETGIEVEFNFAGRDIMTKAVTMLNAGNVPDIIDNDLSEIMYSMAGEGLCVDLTDMFDEPGPEGQDKLSDLFNMTQIDLYRVDGKMYYVPYEHITSGFFYNKVIFREHGWEVPKTWDEFIALNELIKTTSDIAPQALDNEQYYYAFYYTWAVQRVMGAGAFSAACADPTGETWKDPGYLKAAEMIYELSGAGKNYFQEGYEGVIYPVAQNTIWAQNKAAMILCGSWIPVEVINTVAPGFEFGFFQFPTVEGGKGEYYDSEVFEIGCSIPVGAKNIEAAKDFIRFILKEENMKSFVSTTVNMSSRIDVAYPEVLKDVLDVTENTTHSFNTYDGAIAQYGEYFLNLFNVHNTQLILGEVTPEQFIENISNASAQFWGNKQQ